MAQWLWLAAVVLPWLMVGFAFWVVLQVVRQNGRILLRLDAMQERLESIRSAPAAPEAESAPQGLTVGTPAPAFALPDLAGKTRSLADFRGKRVLLVFFGPRCGFCVDMLPRLAALASDRGNRNLAVVVVSSGEREENRRMFEQHGVRCPILLQKELEVAAKYEAFGTPVGYLIDEQGAIASPLAIGSEALLALPSAEPTAAPSRPAKHEGKGNRPLSSSKLVRDGLKAGSRAPDFQLPKVGGGQVSLREYRGRRVVVVFSDPECGPCSAVAPQLEEHHQSGQGPAILMISRRGIEANAQKAAELGLTFPIVVQKNWDTSKDYGMFATPIAYLIDEKGVIAADVAVGGDAILSLLADGSGSADRSGACLEEAVAGSV